MPVDLRSPAGPNPVVPPSGEGLHRRIWFVAGALCVYWLGTRISLPGANATAFGLYFRRLASGYFYTSNIVFGGAVERLAILSLGIFPYIFGLIFMLLVAATFPRVKALKNAGAQGRKRINQYARYLAIVLAAFQANSIALGLEQWPGVVVEPGWLFRISTITTLVTGVVFLIWLGDQITKQGLGNGFVLLLITGTVLGLSSAFYH